MSVINAHFVTSNVKLITPLQREVSNYRKQKYLIGNKKKWLQVWSARKILAENKKRLQFGKKYSLLPTFFRLSIIETDSFMTGIKDLSSLDIILRDAHVLQRKL